MVRYLSHHIRDNITVLLGLLLLSFASLPSLAAGVSLIEVPADSQGLALQGGVWSPCAQNAPKTIPYAKGKVALFGTLNCPVQGGKLPLIVMSHGSGGWFGAHQDTAEALADAGFIVAAITHNGNSYLTGLQDTDNKAILFGRRPHDIYRLINYLLQSWPDADKIHPDKIGFFGFSRGGLTGLIALGGKPDFSLVDKACQKKETLTPCTPPSITTATPDTRITSAVIVDPLFGRLFAGGLEQVKVPIQLWAAELGGDGVTTEDAKTVKTYLPIAPEYHLVRNAGHFAFLPPCPPQLI